MDLQPKKKITGDKVIAAIAAFTVLAVAAVLLVLYFVTGYQGLLYAGLLQLLPGLINVLLLLPKGQNAHQVAEPAQPEQAEGKKKKAGALTLRQRWQKRRIGAQNFWAERDFEIPELDAEESYEKIRQQILLLNPAAEEKTIRKFIRG